MAVEWDKDKPGDGDVVSDYPTDSRDNLLKPLKDAISRDHNFPGTYGTDAGNHNSFEIISDSDDTEVILRELATSIPTSAFKFIIDQDNPDKLVLAGYLTDSTFLGLIELTQFTKAVKLASDFSGPMNEVVWPGTRAFFVQASVPTGWTKIDTNDDMMLRVLNDHGGQTGGSWDPTTVETTPFTAAGSHAHTYALLTDFPSSTANRGGSGHQSALETHKHVISGTASSTSNHNHTFQSDTEWRPQYVDCVLGEKN